MKNRRLKKWVKDTLLMGALTLFIVSITLVCLIRVEQINRQLEQSQR